MKDIKDFERFLNEWCEKNHKPNPGVENNNDIWKSAWEEFVKTELVEEYEERKQEYLDMKLLTHRELAKREAEAKKEKIEEEPKLNDWDKVKKLLK